MGSESMSWLYYALRCSFRQVGLSDLSPAHCQGPILTPPSHSDPLFSHTDLTPFSSPQHHVPFLQHCVLWPHKHLGISFSEVVYLCGVPSIPSEGLSLWVMICIFVYLYHWMSNTLRADTVPFSMFYLCVWDIVSPQQKFAELRTLNTTPTRILEQRVSRYLFMSEIPVIPSVFSTIGSHDVGREPSCCTLGQELAFSLKSKIINSFDFQTTYHLHLHIICFYNFWECKNSS